MKRRVSKRWALVKDLIDVASSAVSAFVKDKWLQIALTGLLSSLSAMIPLEHPAIPQRRPAPVARRQTIDGP